MKFVSFASSLSIIASVAAAPLDAVLDKRAALTGKNLKVLPLGDSITVCRRQLVLLDTTDSAQFSMELEAPMVMATARTCWLA